MMGILKTTLRKSSSLVSLLLVVMMAAQHAHAVTSDDFDHRSERTGSEVVILDAGVPEPELLLGAQTRYEVVRLNHGQEPLRAIAEALSGMDAVEAIHIVSHGAAGELLLSGQRVDQQALLNDSKSLGAIRRALGDGGDIRLYGCNVAATSQGQAFVRTLADLSGADVAASVNATGHRDLGADWQLEYTVGTVEAETPFAAQRLDQFRHTLSHFRGGGITWQGLALDSDGIKNDVQITVKTAWRLNAQNPISLSTSPSFTTTQLSNAIINVTGGASGDYTLQTTIFEARDLSLSTQYLVNYTGGNRISNLLNNAGGNWNIQTLINLIDGNLAPKINFPIIVEVPQFLSDGVTPFVDWTFDIGATDPNADKLRYRLANLTELGGGSSTNPPGLSINPNTGTLTWTGSESLPSGLYSGGIVAEDVDILGNVKSKTNVDIFLDLQPKGTVVFTPSANIPETGNVIVDKGTTFGFSVSGTSINTTSLGDIQSALTEPTEGNFVFDPGVVGSGLIPATYPITFEILDTTGTGIKNYLVINFIVPDPNAPRIANIEADRTIYAATVAQLVDENLDAVVSDVNNADLNGGFLKFNVTFTDGQFEILNVQSVGDGVGEIRLTGTDIFYEGNLIGSTDATEDGVGVALRIDFTTNDATLAAVQALIRSLTYEDTFALRAVGDRSLSTFLQDPDGLSNSNNFFINVQAHPSAPPPGGGPVEASNNLTIVEGQTIALSAENLNYADPDLGDTVTLTVSNVTNGQFELVSAPGSAITSFTQNQVTLGQIAFAHDGGEIAPSYDVSASDGTNSPTAPLPATISFSSVSDEPPTISGTPATTAAENVAYGFTPAVTDADIGDTHTFSITNQPSWASFATGTGVLSGVPGASDVGTHASIVITVTDGGGLSDSLTSFDITVTSAGLAEVIEDIAGNTNATPATAAQLNSIPGVSGAIAGADYSVALAAGSYVDSGNPTPAEIQAVINAVNATNTEALAEVVEDIAGNTNATPVTATQLNAIIGVSGAVMGADYSAALAAGTYADPANPTAAEIQTVIDAVNAANTASLAEVVEDIAGNTNTTPVTAAQLNGIPGVSGAVAGADYSAALAAGTYADPANPTAAEIQTVIDAVNAANTATFAEVVEDIAGNTNTTPVTASQLNGIPGVSGAIAGADYSAALAAGTYVDPANPAAAEIQTVIDAVNAANTAALAEVVEDIAGNTNTTPVTAAQLNGIPGVSGAIAGADYTTALAAGSYVDPANPTAAEIQAVIDAVNAANGTALAEVVEDITGNTNTTPVTAVQLNGIPGVSGAVDGADYTTALAAGTYVDPANPTAAEIQAVINVVNAANTAALAEVVEDIAGNTNTTPVTAAQLNGIPGVSGAIGGADYSTALAAGSYVDPANPTAAEIQAVIDAVNAANGTALAEVVEDIAGNTNATPVTSAQLNAIPGVSGAIVGANYAVALAAGTYADPANPTAAEIQAVINAVNAANVAGLAEVIEDIAGNTNASPVTATQLNAIIGVSGALPATDYTVALAAGAYVDPANPTPAEIQAVIDAVNATNAGSAAGVNEVVEDIAGNSNATSVTAAQLNAIIGVNGAVTGAGYVAALAAGTFADPANPTAAEIQTIIDAVNAANTVALAEVAEDIAGNTNAIPVTAAQLNGIPGVSGAIGGADYAAALATGSYADPANPTAVEIQAVIDAVNAANTSALGEVVEDIAGNTNVMPVTAAQLNGIPGVSGAVTGADYTAALVAGTYADSANPTAAEIQVVIDAVNAANITALGEVVEDIAGNTNTTAATAAQLNGIPGVTGAVAGADYATALAAGSYADPANPTAAEIQAVIDAVNGANGVSLTEVVEDIAGNTNAVPITAGQLNGIPGVSGAVAGADYATALAAGTYVDPANPTAAEIQTVIDAVNAANTAALGEVVEDIAGNANTTPVTAAQLNGIPGVTGAIDGEDYATVLAAGTYVDPANPTPAEIQAVIDAVNATSAAVVAALAEVAEDIAGDTNTTPVTAIQLNGIPGVSGAVDGVDYTTALAAGTYVDPENPTAAEIQSVVNAVNAANAASTTGLGEVIEDIAGNTNGIIVSATQLNDITGVSGAINGADYTAGLAAGAYADPANPTAAELQVVIDTVNAANAAALAEVVEDISGNPNAVPATAAELNAIPGVEGAINEVDYSSALAAGTYADPANPTKAEIQAVIDAVNSDSSLALAEVVEDIAGNTNTIPVTAIQLNAIPGVGGALDGIDYSIALAAGTYVDPANPTVAEIQTVIDSVAGGSSQSFIGSTATGTGIATATISGGGATCAFDPISTIFVPTSSVATSAPTSNVFIHGLFNFRLIQCTPGSTVDVTIRWPSSEIPAGSELWKFGPASAGAADSWFQPASAVINAAANEITYSVVNNGAGDSDSDPNIIVDPIGLAIPDGGVAPPVIPGVPGEPAQKIPTLSEWARIILVMLIGVVALIQQGRRRKDVAEY